MKTKPIIFRHKGDGNWRCRSQDEKGRWRTAKFETGKHEPGRGDEPPRVTEKGSFYVIPKAIRDTRLLASEAKPEPVAGKAAESPQPEPNSAKDEPAKLAEPEIAKQPQAEDINGFPEFCTDARGKGGAILGEADIASTTDGALPEIEPEPPQETEVPLVEIAIDAMFQFGEKLGGPKAPKSATMETFSTEGLRDQMVLAAKRVMPNGLSVKLGPWGTLGACMAQYLTTCYAMAQSREVPTPLFVKMKIKLASWWMKAGHWKQRRKAAKAETIDEPTQENETNA